MASEGVLQKLKQRADLADRIALELRSRIDVLKSAAASSGSSGEEEKLRKENDKLKAEINNIKLEITLAEIKNGVKQVFMPVHTPASTVNCVDNKIPETPSITNSQTAPVKQAEKKSATENGKNKKPKEAKPKKENKPKAPAVEEKIDISRLDMRVGKIVGVKKHPDADSLYVEDVDIGEEKIRTIVSGLVKHVPLDQMQDRLAVFMCNLKPAKMRGILSEGMIMCASCPEKVEILVPPPGVVIGDRVTVKDFPGQPDIQLNPKKKIWETLKPDVRTNQQRVATYKGSPFTIEGKGEVTAPTLADTQIS
ncbi:hypothetical protein LOTGIDRAFT_132539 [Lottia gigantea]|uniref:tRNA-binding domain-containing protein n=1 Tax=Lottia gigantea TaxID=225164 RepID=V3ZSI4_LOTGI|nr:hypothetical protein LOTGIDRAFT_132539 [Lottia gigantea]ESO83836.1 hypothetical protein LOTGIDRAFT_132539 [Lottia gigantea]